MDFGYGRACAIAEISKLGLFAGARGAEYLHGGGVRGRQIAETCG